MKVLGIETSCDETALSVLSVNGEFPDLEVEILSNVISSQIKVHRPWGGVVPNLARREHQKNLIPLLVRSLKESRLITSQRRLILSKKERSVIKENLAREKSMVKKLKSFLRRYKKPDLDLIAVTIGPGLEPALWVGVNLAFSLSKIWQVPIIPVDHIEAHIAANWLSEPKPAKWPIIALVVSGGHTELVLMKKPNSYEIIGQTRDDAAGECFDKTARILELGYPGGPAISKLADQWRQLDQGKAPLEIRKISLPRPMLQSTDHDFSFSGLKTAVLYFHQRYPEELKKSPFYRLKMAAEIETAIADVLTAKTIKAAQENEAPTILLGGGVSANKWLREKMAEKARQVDCSFFAPPVDLCTDNAAIIALTGVIHSKKARLFDTIKVEANLNLGNG